MEPVEFIKFAEYCAGNIPGEASARSAVSRAYYAAYHVSSSYLEKKSIPVLTGRGGKHTAIIRTVHAMSHPESQRYSGLLQSLKNQRERADYAIRDPMVSERMSKAIRNAHEIIQWFEQLS